MGALGHKMPYLMPISYYWKDSGQHPRHNHESCVDLHLSADSNEQTNSHLCPNPPSCKCHCTLRDVLKSKTRKCNIIDSFILPSWMMCVNILKQKSWHLPHAESVKLQMQKQTTFVHSQEAFSSSICYESKAKLTSSAQMVSIQTFLLSWPLPP